MVDKWIVAFPWFRCNLNQQSAGKEASSMCSTVLLVFLVALLLTNISVLGSSGDPLHSGIGKNIRVIAREDGVRFTPFKLGTSAKPDKQQKSNYVTRTRDDFVTRGSRLGFIRKVYAIFSVQMLSTIAVTYVIMNNRNIAQLLLQNYQSLSIGCLLASTGIVVALVSSPALRHTSPVNFILLGIHTFLQSLMVGSFSSLLNPRTVCLGTIHTLAAFVAIALYTFQPNPQYDFTVLGNTLLTALTSLVVGSVLGLFYDMPLYDNLLSGALAVLFAVYLFHDMQKIVGGTHKKRQYGQKEYILAALNLYQDAISLYMQIAKLLHEQDKRKRRDD